MGRNAGVQVENNFTKGLITEATGLNFPENACTETYNCVFDKTGLVYRRLGIDYEVGYSVANTVTRSESVFSEFSWQAVAGQGDLNFTVAQIGNLVYFWEVNSIGSLSAGKKTFTINLESFKVSGAPATKTKAAQFASGKGYLFIAHPYCEPMYVTYNTSSGTISTTKIDITIRDFEGVKDDQGLEARLPTITVAHKYNIYNQGWYMQAAIARNTPDHNDNRFGIIGEGWRSLTGYWPSNTQIWWTYKDSFNIAIAEYDGRKMTGNSPAPKGHYILNAFYQDRASVSGVSGIQTTTSGFNRPSSVAFFAGRAFYTSVPAGNYGSKIYFSQIIERDTQLGQCYQENDPTSEIAADLLPSDGGVIQILEAGTIYRMVPVDASLVVFASNGIWTISGSQGTAFSANDYAVKKLAGVETRSATSFVVASGLPVWWNQDGIYGITVDQSLGTLSVQSLVDQTIQDFYDLIPNSSKSYVKGAYNPLTRRVQWLYRSTPAVTVDQNYEYDRVLSFDTSTGVFYPWTISTGEDFPKVNGIIVNKGNGITRVQENVTTNAGVLVTNNALVAVTSTTESVTELSASFRFVTTKVTTGTTNQVTFSQERNINYLDWVIPTTTGVSYESFFITGYKVHGEGVRKFQSNYLSMYSQVEIGSSFFVQGQWNFTTTGNSGKWSTKQQGYRPSTTQKYNWSRLKIRGTGNSLQFRVSSETSKPFFIIGYSLFETSNASP